MFKGLFVSPLSGWRVQRERHRHPSNGSLLMLQCDRNQNEKGWSQKGHVFWVASSFNSTLLEKILLKTSIHFPSPGQSLLTSLPSTKPTSSIFPPRHTNSQAASRWVSEDKPHSKHSNIHLLTYSVTWLLPIKKWSLSLSSDPLLQSGWKPHQWIEGILVNCTTWALGKLQNPPLPSQTFLLGIQLPFSQETQATSLSMLREN